MARKLQFSPIRSLMADEQDENDSVAGLVKGAARRLISLSVAPFRVAVSKPAQKLYLTSAFFFIASVVLLTVSSIAYSIFYYNYIPQISLDQVVHLQFGDNIYPYGIATLPPHVLTTNQPYDVYVTLGLPRTPQNLEAGNFMIDLQLLSSSPADQAASSTKPLSSMLTLKDHTLVAHSRRPTILPQPTHSLVSLVDTLFLRLPWSIITYPLHPFRKTSILTLGSDDLEIPMFEGIAFDTRSSVIPGYTRLELHTLKHVQTLQVYNAAVHFRAKFTGMKYIVYNYRVISFLVFTSLFYGTSVATMSFAWFLVSLVFWIRRDSTSEGPKPQKKLESDPSDTLLTNDSAIKGEPEPSSDQLPASIPSQKDASGGIASRIKSEPLDESFTRTSQIAPLDAAAALPSDSEDATRTHTPAGSTDLSTWNDRHATDTPSYSSALDRTSSNTRAITERRPSSKADTAADSDDDVEDADADARRGRDVGFDSGIGTSVAGDAGTSAREWEGESGTWGRSTGRRAGSEGDGQGELWRRSRSFEE